MTDIEYSDVTIVDDQDIVIGQDQLINAMKNSSITRVVRVYVFNSSGELLIQKRSPLVFAPNLWDQSVGGHVDAGETYEQSARRETREELGITEELDLQEVAHYRSFESGNIAGYENKFFNKLFKAIYDGPITANPSEISEVKWVTLEELRNKLHNSKDEYAHGFIKSWQEYNKTITKS